MKSYYIEEIYGDGYERWAKIKMDNSFERVYVHFIEYDEYLENTNVPIKRKKGDIINGILKIGLVTKCKVIDEDRKGYNQCIHNSSHITAIATVKEVYDSDIMVCRIEGLGDAVIVEFENDVNVEVNTKIEVNGSLELEIE